MAAVEAILEAAASADLEAETLAAAVPGEAGENRKLGIGINNEQIWVTNQIGARTLES